MTEDKYEEVTAEGIKFEKEGDSIEGVLESVTPSTQYEGQNNYDIKTKDGIKTVFGTTVLNTKLAKISLGSKIKIVYLGETKSKSGRFYRDFQVFVAK